jgi:hypothetical protein
VLASGVLLVFAALEPSAAYEDAEGVLRCSTLAGEGLLQSVKQLSGLSTIVGLHEAGDGWDVELDCSAECGGHLILL